MAAYLGGTALNKCYVGSSPVQKLYLGSTLVWSAAAVYTDNFNRANASTPGSNWLTSGNVIGIVSNSLGVSGTSTSPANRAAIWKDPVNTDNMAVEWTVASGINNNAGSGPVLRSNAGMTEMLAVSSAGNGWALGYMTGGGITGTFNIIGSSTSVTISNGATMRAEIINDVFKLFINGSQSGSSITTSQYRAADHRYLGWWTARSGSSNGYFMDDFTGKDA